MCTPMPAESCRQVRLSNLLPRQSGYLISENCLLLCTGASEYAIIWSMQNDTIAAIATPPGIGGIGVIRVSGPDAFAAVLPLLCQASGHTDLPQSHLLTYGHIVDPATREIFDEVLVAFMRAPRTYTREDVVEIQGHGGPLLLQRVLRLLLASGARLANPGEFTLRAFLNGRLDLAQAESL